MISLKKHLENVDEQGRLLDELETSYKSALERVENSLPKISERLVGQYRQAIRDLRARLERDFSRPVIREVREGFADQLKSFVAEADKLLEFKDQQFKEILRSFAEAASTLARQSAASDDRLNGFTRSLESLIDLQDLGEIRKRLVREVAELKQVVGELGAKNRESVRQLRAELNHFQEKLAHTEEMARTDALTGIRNRRSGEQAIQVAAVAGRQLSVVLIDVNGFKGINDHWGHAAGDEVLKQFARRLSAAVRTGDVVCRWGGDEFLVVLPNCSLEQAVSRTRAISLSCEGEYLLNTATKQIVLRLRAAIGIAEWQAGESIEAVINRADQALYKAKGNRRGLSRGAVYDCDRPAPAH